MTTKTLTKEIINTVIDGGRDMKEKRERKPFEPRKVLIRPNKNGDSRTAEKCPTFGDFENANKSHRSEVREMMKQFGMLIIERGKSHDWTKVKEPQKSQFYADLCSAMNNKDADFTKMSWYPMHCNTERHHLNTRCPEDVNLIDIVEMVADCVCAGMARSGEVYPIEIDTTIFQKAINNTMQYMIDELIEIKDYSNPTPTQENHPVSKVDEADTEVVDANQFDESDKADSDTPKETFSPKEKKVFTKTK